MSNVTPLSSASSNKAPYCQQVTLASVTTISFIALAVLVHPAFLVGAVGIASFSLYKAYKNLELWPNRYDPLFREIFSGTPYDFDKLPVYPTLLTKDLEPSELKNPVTRCVYGSDRFAVQIKVASELGEQSFISLVCKPMGLYIYGIDDHFTEASISKQKENGQLTFGYDNLTKTELEFDKIADRTGGQECSRTLREDEATIHSVNELKKLLNGQKLTIRSLPWSISLTQP